MRVADFIAKKGERPLVMATAYDYLTARSLSDAELDAVLVGDSIGNVFQGHPDTLSVTVDEIIYHSQAVSRGLSGPLLVADMPFLSSQISEEDIKRNAGRLIKEGRAAAVKIEVQAAQAHYVKAVVDMGIPVMAHIGFTPQFIHQLGGYKVQGRDPEHAKALVELAKQLDDMGVFSILLELVPQSVSKAVTEAISVPSIGIGAGPHCDGQILVTQDICGLSPSPPRFVKQYADLSSEIKTAVSSYRDEVRARQFPGEQYSID